MSHGDSVSEMPLGFEISGANRRCNYATIANDKLKIYGVQFHPEVVHTLEGKTINKKFCKRHCWL